MTNLGSFFFKSPRGGRGHGTDFAHIQYLITIRYTKTKSDVLGQIMTKFSKNGGLNFLCRNGNPGLKFTLFLYYANFMILSHHFGYA